MDDDREAVPREQRRHRYAIRQIKPLELKRRSCENIEPGLLQRRIVVGIEIIDADDTAAGLQATAARRGIR